MNSVSLPCFSSFAVDPIIHFIVLYKTKQNYCLVPITISLYSIYSEVKITNRNLNYHL